MVILHEPLPVVVYASLELPAKCGYVGRFFLWFSFAFIGIHGGLRIQLVVVAPAGYETIYAGPADTACDCPALQFFCHSQSW